MKKYILLIFISILTPLFSQEAKSELPLGFRGIDIGLSLEEVQNLLKNDKYFNYRGDPDLSMLLSESKSIIETKGNIYIENGYFQFYKDTLYTITLILDTKKVDYYTMFTKLKSKYGKYNSLTSKIVVWENENIKISLEKPLTIKYVGLNVYNQLVQEDTTRMAIEEENVKDFIDAF